MGRDPVRARPAGRVRRAPRWSLAGASTAWRRASALDPNRRHRRAGLTQQWSRSLPSTRSPSTSAACSSFPTTTDSPRPSRDAGLDVDPDRLLGRPLPGHARRRRGPVAGRDVRDLRAGVLPPRRPARRRASTPASPRSNRCSGPPVCGANPSPSRSTASAPSTTPASPWPSSATPTAPSTDPRRRRRVPGR